MALGIESLPVQTVGGDSGDSGENVSDIKHRYSLMRKAGEA
jgi:hypothetical protein